MRSNFLMMETYSKLKQILITSGITPAEGYFILQTLKGELQEALDMAISQELQDNSEEVQIEKEPAGQE